MRSAAICRHLSRATTDRRTDGDLLAAFVAGPSEDAFAELVRRHGPLVWGACRRLLPDTSDAEDAFQAAFLVLVRRARRLTHGPALGPWLHRVAVWTARNIRRKNARRLARQSALPDHVPDPTPPADADLKSDLDAALLALPARYRDPVVLCHLLGFSRREAAERLGCPEGTLSARLSRGLVKLRDRLRGLDPAKVLSIATAGVPVALTATTARAAVSAAVAAASIPPTVSVLVEGVVRMLWVKKATAAAFALSAVFALGVGVGLSTRTESTGVAAQDGPAKAPAPKSKESQPSADANVLAMEYEALLRFNAKVQAAIDSITAQLKKGEPDAKKLELLVDTLANLQKEADNVAAELKAVKEKHAKLSGAAARDASAGKDINAELADLRSQIARLNEQRQKLDEQAKLTADRRAVIESELALNSRTTQELLARVELAKLNGADVKAHTECLELTVGGKAGEFEFVIRELARSDLTERGLQAVYGPVTTRDPAMLTKLLARAKNDPAGPRLVRVVVRPTAVRSAGPAGALKACHAAGYQTVKFSGYVFQGGFPVQLSADQTGDVYGYKEYRQVEVKTAELLKEIEEGMN